MDKKKIKELFEYAIQDPKKWIYEKDNDCVIYHFADYEFIYNSQKELFFVEKSNQFTKSTNIHTKHPMIFYPFILSFWKSNEMAPIAFLLLILVGMITFLVFTLVISGCVAIINLFGAGIPYESNLFIYSVIFYPIIYVLYGIGFYFFNKKTFKKLSVLDIMRDSGKKIAYENKIEKENEDFNKLVEEHFKKQSRKAKLEKIMKDEKG